MCSLEQAGEMRQGWTGLRAGIGRSRAGPYLAGESGQCHSLQTLARSQVGSFTGNPTWWIQTIHQDCHARETSPLKKVQFGLSYFGREERGEDLKMRRKRRKLVMGDPQHH